MVFRKLKVYFRGKIVEILATVVLVVGLRAEKSGFYSSEISSLDGNLDKQIGEERIVDHELIDEAELNKLNHSFAPGQRVKLGTGLIVNDAVSNRASLSLSESEMLFLEENNVIPAKNVLSAAVLPGADGLTTPGLGGQNPHKIPRVGKGSGGFFGGLGSVQTPKGQNMRPNTRLQEHPSNQNRSSKPMKPKGEQMKIKDLPCQ